MNKPSPWEGIKRPENNYNVRRLPSPSVAPLYWAKDIEGHCLFVIEIEGDHTEYYRRNQVTIRGIRVDLRLLDAERTQGLVLTLEQHIDRDIFQALCETIASSLQHEVDPTAVPGVVLTHIKRWKAFMAGRKPRILSAEEIRGLFAELQFLRTLYQGDLSEKSSVRAWSGPDGIQQDFVFGNTAVEIKSISGKERNSVRISSEDQLESRRNRLFLVIFHLSDLPDSDHALSLNDLVHRIESELTDAEAIEYLFCRLGAAGYVKIHEYDEPKFLVTAKQGYRIVDGFPRIVRSGLQNGIRRVGYDIELETIKPYECETEDVRGADWN